MSADDTFSIDFSETDVSVSKEDNQSRPKPNTRKSLFMQRLKPGQKTDNDSVSFPKVHNIISTQDTNTDDVHEKTQSTPIEGIIEDPERKLQSMQPNEINDMISEVKQTLKPEHYEFLRQRALKKAMVQKANPTVDSIEQEKTKWMEPVTMDAKESKGTVLEGGKYRFDFNGTLLSYVDRDGRKILNEVNALDEEQTLLHHGDDPSFPGYTIDELVHLSSSTFPAQRIPSLNALYHIVHNAKRCLYSIPNDRNDIHFVNSILLSHFMNEGKVFVTLRHLIDSSHKSTIYSAIKVFYAALTNDSDEIIYSIARKTWKGYEVYTLEPSSDASKEPMQRTDDTTDADIVKNDMVEGIIDMQYLERIRYILEVLMPEDSIVEMILKIILRISRSSCKISEKVLQCHRLLGFIMDTIKSKVSESITLVCLKIIHALCLSSRKACMECIEDGIGELIIPLLIPVESTPGTMDISDEAFFIWEACLRYGLMIGYTLNCLDTLASWLVTPQNVPMEQRNRVKANIIKLFDGLIDVSILQDEGVPLPKYRCNWANLSPLLQYSLASLKDDTLDINDPYSYRLVASSSHFIASYIERIYMSDAFDLDVEKVNIMQIAHTVVMPFLQRKWFMNLLDQCIDGSIWDLDSDRNDISNIGRYAASLVNLPALSWKAQHQRKGITDFNKVTLTLLLDSLLGLVRLIDVVGQADSRFVAQLTASEISALLLGILNRYIAFSMLNSSSKPALYLSRVSHLTAFYLIKILYHQSSVAQEASLICVGCLFPSDADFVRYLLKRSISFASDLDTTESKRSQLNLENFYTYLLDEAIQNIELDPAFKVGLSLTFESKALPLSKIWPYLPILQYKDYIHADQEDKSIGIPFVTDSLNFIHNLEVTSGGYTSKVKRAIKLKTMMTCFLLGSEVYTDEGISSRINTLFDMFLLKGWEPLRLSLVLDVPLLQNMVRQWANESFGDPVFGKMITCWALAGASLSLQELENNTQRAELVSLEECLWPELEKLWHTLPKPPEKLVKCWLQEGMRRRSLINYYIKCLASPHARKNFGAIAFYRDIFVTNIKKYLEECSNFDLQITKRKIVDLNVSDFLNG